MEIVIPLRGWVMGFVMTEFKFLPILCVKSLAGTSVIAMIANIL
jgi:hypothetical protein